MYFLNFNIVSSNNKNYTIQKIVINLSHNKQINLKLIFENMQLNNYVSLPLRTGLVIKVWNLFSIYPELNPARGKGRERRGNKKIL